MGTVGAVINSLTSAISNGLNAAQTIIANNGSNIPGSIQAAIDAAVQTGNATVQAAKNASSTVQDRINAGVSDAIAAVNNSLANAQVGA